MAPTRGHFVALISPQVGDQGVDARPGRGVLWTPQTIVLSKGSETTPKRAEALRPRRTEQGR
jgi:hypothetical protein